MEKKKLWRGPTHSSTEVFDDCHVVHVWGDQSQSSCSKAKMLPRVSDSLVGLGHTMDSKLVSPQNSYV